MTMESLRRFDASAGGIVFALVLLFGVIYGTVLKQRWKVPLLRKGLETHGDRMLMVEQQTHPDKDEGGAELDVYNSITALSNFDWKAKAPLALRPFKPTYHLTMGTS